MDAGIPSPTSSDLCPQGFEILVVKRKKAAEHSVETDAEGPDACREREREREGERDAPGHSSKPCTVKPADYPSWPSALK